MMPPVLTEGKDAGSGRGMMPSVLTDDVHESGVRSMPLTGGGMTGVNDDDSSEVILEEEEPQPQLRRSTTVAFGEISGVDYVSSSGYSRTLSNKSSKGYASGTSTPYSGKTPHVDRLPSGSSSQSVVQTPSSYFRQPDFLPEELELKRNYTAPGDIDERKVRPRHHLLIGETRPDEAVDQWSSKQQNVAMTEKDREQIWSQVKKNRVCALLDKDDISTIVDNMRCFNFAAGETLARQGDVGHYFCVVYSGFLEVYLDDDKNAVNTMGPGESFGGSALLLDGPKTVSIVAKRDSTVWGIDGETYRSVVAADSKRRHEDMMDVLERIDIFAGLSLEMKTAVGEKAIYSEMFDTGDVIIQEGEIHRAVCFVKTGKISSYAGAVVDADRRVSGGTLERTLKENDSFGKYAALYRERSRSTTTMVASTKCELVCLGIKSMQSVLGNDNIKEGLEHCLLLQCLDTSTGFSQFSDAQNKILVKCMETIVKERNELIAESVDFIVCLEGQVYQPNQVLFLERSEHAESTAWTREEELMVKKMSSRGMKALKAQRSLQKTHVFEDDELTDLVAGPNGARCALLSKERFVAALPELGIEALDEVESEEIISQARRRLQAKKVPIFHHLTSEQVDTISNSFMRIKHDRGHVFYKRGDVVSDFWIITDGEVEELLDGKVVRRIGRNGHFGERALLLQDSRRKYTVRVVSDHAEFWQLERDTFDENVIGSAREELVQRLQLRDTSVSLKDLETKRIVGRGSFGVVTAVEYQCPESEQHLRYALKKVRRRGGKADEHLQNECDLLKEIDHPCILQLVRTFRSARSTYILTELLTGGDLLDALNRMENHSFTPKQTQFYAGTLVLVLDYLHERQIVYRDLKSENVMLDWQGYIKLIDFGIAKRIVDNRTTTFIGSFHFMAPEMATGKGYGVEVDLWSLGVMIYDLIFCKLPFAAELDCRQENLVEICNRIATGKLEWPKGYSDVRTKHLIRSLLKKEPRDRLGARGIEELWQHDFFQLEDHHREANSTASAPTLFDLLLARQLPAPFVPESETHEDDSRHLNIEPPSDVEEQDVSDYG